MKQFVFPPKRKTEHGGVFALGKRRSKRPLNLKQPLHLTLRSERAYGVRSLLRHRPVIDAISKKAARRFRVRIYEKAICGNHMHLLVKAQTRFELQNFFRVLAGHVAQEILRIHPLQKHELLEAGGAPGCKKNQRKFWSLLLYSRILTWGREYLRVKRYVIQNTLEALKLIPYQKRKSRFNRGGRCPAGVREDTS